MDKRDLVKGQICGRREERAITYQDVLMLGEGDPYYDIRRWEYYKEAIKLAGNTVGNSILEVGPYRRPLFSGSDILDCWAGANPTYLHDASVTPWPIAGRRYDLLVALQVWEHLGSSQASAFEEVMRVSKRAVLSFPYMWECPGDVHHGIGYDKIEEWTQGFKHSERRHVGSRVVYLFQF